MPPDPSPVPSRPLLPLLTALWLAASAAAGASSNLPPGHPPMPTLRPGAQAPVPAGPPIDLNSASRAQLKTLPGIGDAEARRIIAARPYPSKFKLLADNVLSPTQFDAIRQRVVAIQKPPPPKPGSTGQKKADAPAKSPP